MSQNSSSLVKHLSLEVLALSLQRAAAVLEPTDSSTTGGVEGEGLRDSVLRSLPDMKTIIALHHNLLKGGEVGAQAVTVGSETPPELRLRSEGVCKEHTVLNSQTS